MTAHIPQEIIDHIVDCNHNDLKALRASCLISRRWVYPSRYHLFHTVTVTNRATVHRLADLIRNSPNITPLIQELCVDATANYRNPRLELWVMFITNVPFDMLVRLGKLHFKQVEWERLRPFFPMFFNNLPPLASRIKELNLSGCSFLDFRDFKSLVLAFGALSKLSIDALTFQRNVPERLRHPEKGTMDRLQLSCLELGRYAECRTVVKWLSSTPSSTSLRSATFLWVMARDAVIIGTLLYGLRASLRDLKIGCRFEERPWMTKSMNDFIDLSHNVELRSLHLVVSDLQDELTPWVPTLLTQASHAPLTRITLELWLHDWRQLTGPVWDEVDEILSSNAFSRVPEFVFLHRGDLNMRNTTLAVERRFQRLHNRCALRIENGSTFLAEGLAFPR